MVRPPCCDEISSLKKGPWTSEEDQRLVDYINRQGHGSWRSLPRLAGLNRCGKSCRLRWINYLRPDIKRGRFSEEEERIIINLHSVLGNKWSKIASHLPGRTDNEIKNFWNTHIRKKFRQMGIDPITHQPRTDLSHLLSSSQILFPSPCGNLMMSPFWDNNALKLQTDATQLVKIQLLQNLLQVMNTSTIIPNTDPQSNHSGVLGFDPNLDPFPNVMTQTTMNPGSSHQATGEVEAHANSWTWFEAGLIDQLEGPDGNIQQESMLPPLIHASSDEISQIEKKSSGAHDHLATFEAWEKFMDDETSDSYWKTILDLTPLSSSSSIIW